MVTDVRSPACADRYGRPGWSGSEQIKVETSLGIFQHTYAIGTQTTIQL